MKNNLRFESEKDFQDFFAQIRGAEIPDFQAIEGSGGDMGLDGIDDDTAYQVYFPEPKNRTESNYISKIDTDLEKAIKANTELELGIKKWIFVVPEDLRPKVVAHLRKKTDETGIKCLYWGATKLEELVGKFPHVRNSFPSIFLPDYAPKFDQIVDKIDNLPTNTHSTILDGVEVVPDTIYSETIKAFREEYNNELRNIVNRFGTNSSTHIAAGQIAKEKIDRQIRELNLKKERSDKAYAIALEELNETFDEKLSEIREDYARRNIFDSGMRIRDEGKLGIKRQRAIDKLNLIFGKETK